MDSVRGLLAGASPYPVGEEDQDDQYGYNDDGQDCHGDDLAFVVVKVLT